MTPAQREALDGLSLPAGEQSAQPHDVSVIARVLRGDTRGDGPIDPDDVVEWARSHEEIDERAAGSLIGVAFMVKYDASYDLEASPLR